MSLSTRRPLTMRAAVFLLPLLVAACASFPSRSPHVADTASKSATSQPLPQPVLVFGGPEEGFRLALDAFSSGMTVTAGRYAKSVADRYPRTAWGRRALFLQGKSLLAQARTGEAEQLIVRLPAEYPDLADYGFSLLAEQYASMKRSDDAVKFFRRIVDVYPDGSLAGRASLRTGQVLLAAGSFDAAAEAFAKTLRDYGGSDAAAEAGLGLAQAREEAGDLAAAARALLDVSVRYPGGDREQAIEKSLNRLKTLGAPIPLLTADEWYERGRSLFRMALYDKASDAFTRALASNPAHHARADMLLKSGIALYNLNRRPEAASTLERLIREKLPDCRCAEALAWLGKSYSRMGLRDEAIAAYRKLVRLYPDSDWADDALYLAGNVWRDAGDMPKALGYYRKLASEYPDSSFADSALWWEGWSWYTAGEYKKSLRILQQLVQRYPTSFLVNQALYWEGRAYEAMDDSASARRQYRRIASRGPYTYYGMRAAERIAGADQQIAAPDDDDLLLADADADADAVVDDAVFDDETSDGPPVWTEDAIALLSTQPAYRRTLELMFLGMKKEASGELALLQELMPGGRRALLGLSKTYFELGDYYNSLMIVLRNYERYLERPSARLPDDLWLLAYPQGYWQSISTYARSYNLDPFFVAAIIREESQFKTDALSPAGARGVMQVMPSTGAWIARTVGLAGFNRSKLYDADANIAVGAWYLSSLLKRFHGDYALTAAAYNAGPEPVLAWAGKGDRTDAAAFVETIPYAETRSYVKKVLRNYAEYRRIYGRTPSVAGPAVPVSSADTAKGKEQRICKATGACQ